jgi:hypothetical protein
LECGALPPLSFFWFSVFFGVRRFTTLMGLGLVEFAPVQNSGGRAPHSKIEKKKAASKRRTPKKNKRGG